MAGSMRRRGRDSWQLRVYRGVDGSGRPRWVTTTVRGSRRHAAARLAELVAEVGHARLRSGSVGELLERWFAAASPRWAATTTAQTRSIIECHLAPELGHIRVEKLTTADIDDFYSHLQRGGGRNGRPLGPGTVHRIHVVLHRALAQAVRWEWIWVNPVSSASPPRVPPAEVHPPDPAQVADLLASVRERSPALFVFLRLAVCTGARRSQLLALRWRDVDFDHGALSFTRAVVTGQHGMELRPTKTHRTYRVEIDDETLAVLADYCATLEGSEGLSAGYGYVFSSAPDRSKPWLPNWVTKQFIAAPAGGSRSFSPARSPPFHGHADAGRRRAHRHRVATAQPRPDVDDAQRLRPRRPRRRPGRGRDAGRHPRDGGKRVPTPAVWLASGRTGPAPMRNAMIRFGASAAPRQTGRRTVGPMATNRDNPILDGVVTPDGAIVVDRAQVARLGLGPGSHVALRPVPGRRIRSYLGAGDHLGPARGPHDFRQSRDELWKGFGEEITP
ncbi:MAG: tyrosine-type recombinase/integrase [Acidimicrobiia bacterium]